MSITFAPDKEAQQVVAPPPQRPPESFDEGRWNRIFLDQKEFARVTRTPGMLAAQQMSLTPEDYPYRQAMISYLAESRGMPVEDAASIFDVEKDVWAAHELGKPVATAREWFEHTKGQFERKEKKKQAYSGVIENVMRRSLQDALDGTDTPHAASVEADLAAAGDLFDDADKEELRDRAQEADMKVRAAQYRYGDDAKFLFQELQRATGQTSGDNKVDYDELAARFASLPDEQRKAIYEMAGAFAHLQGVEKGFFHQLAESLGRGASDFYERIPRNLSEEKTLALRAAADSQQPLFVHDTAVGPVLDIQMKGMAKTFGADEWNIARLGEGREATPEERAEIVSALDKKLGILKVQRELRDLAEREIDPIQSVLPWMPHIVEQGLYGAARSLPYTAAAAVPGAGTLAVYGALYAQTKDDMVMDGIPIEKAGPIAAVLAVPMAAIEHLKVASLTRRMPTLAALAKELTHAGKRGTAMRIGMQFGATVAEQNVQEWAQNILPPIAQAIGAALDKDIPGYDFEKAFREMPETLGITFVATLPLSLISGGFIARTEIKRGKAYIQNVDRLVNEAGYSPQAADRIASAETGEEAVKILQEEAPKRLPENVAKAAKNAIERMENAQNAQRNEVEPTVRRHADGTYDVIAPDGTSIAENVDSATAVDEVIRHVKNWEAATQTGVKDAIDFFQKVAEARGRGESLKLVFENAPQTLLDDFEANPNEENLNRLFETVRAFGHDINEPAELAMFPVLASNQGALRDGIYKSIIRIHQGANIEHVIRDFAQDNLKRAIAEKRISLDWVKSQLEGVIAETEKGIEGRKLNLDTDTAVIESFSDIAIAYMTGKRKLEEIPAGLRGFIVRLGVAVRDIVRRAYRLGKMAAEGRLDRDFESLLAESVGLSVQAKIDQAAEATVREFAGANYSIAPITPAEETAAMADAAQAFEDLQTEAQERLRRVAAKQKAEVRARYEGTPQWMKAPNGEDTKLTEDQWLAVRTPLFKRWFGDWETLANLENALRQQPEEIAFAEAPSTNPEKRREAQRIARSITEPVRNQATGKEIRVSVGRAQHFSNFTGDPRKWSLLPRIKDLLERAAFIRTETPDARKADDKNIHAYHKFALPVNLQDESLLARLTIQEDSNGNWFYDANLLKIEKLADDSTGLSTLADDQTPDIQRAVGNIALSGFKVNPESVSKARDVNGEPMVVYHGTGESFDAFDISKVKRGNLAPGFYFDIDPNVAGSFANKSPFNPTGGNIVPVFLNIRNPQTGADSQAQSHGFDGVVKGGTYAAFNSNQIKSATANEGMFSGSGNINYSITTPAEQARVAKALEALGRAPEERLALYSKLKERFDRMTVRGQEIIAAVKAENYREVSHEKVVQAIGLMNGILMVVPPEVRAKAGGLVQVASISPMDVYRGDEKVSEVKSRAGAIISAWMREGLNIGEAGKKTELPQGYRVINKSGARMDKALADAMVRKIEVIGEKLEGFLREEYLADIRKQLSKARPEAGENKIVRSKVGPEAQRIADAVFEAVLLDADKTSEEMDTIERKLGDLDIDPNEHTALLERWGILNAFGDIDNRTAMELASASDWLRKTLKTRRNKWKMLEDARRAGYKAVVAESTRGLKRSGKTQDNKTKHSEVIKQFIEGNVSTIQVLRAWMPSHPFFKELEYRISKAEQTKDINGAKRAQGLLDAVSRGLEASGQSSGWLDQAKAMHELTSEQKAIKLSGEARTNKQRMEIQQAERLVSGELAASDLNLTREDVFAAKAALDAMTPEQRARRTFVEWETQHKLPTETVEITKDDALQYILSWDQPDVRERMERQGWTEGDIAELNKMTSDPVSRSVLEFLREDYEAQYQRMNAVYRVMFGMDMPRVLFYAPTRYLHSKDSQDISPFGSTMEVSGMVPGSTKRRQNHNAKLRTIGAMDVFQQNVAQTEHWMAMAEINRDIRGVFMNSDMRDAIRTTFGTPFMQMVDSQINALTNGGSIKAGELMADKWFLSHIIGGKSIASLGFSIRTVFNQFDAAYRGSLHIGTINFFKAMADPKFMDNVPKAWHSDAVQRRLLAGSNPMIRYVYEAAKMNPSQFLAFAQASMLPMQYTDASLTAFTGAVVYTHHYNAAIKAGANETMAEAAAVREMEYAIFNYSQPIDTANRSVRETQGGMLIRAMMLFMSDNRFKSAMAIEAVKIAKTNPKGAINIIASHAIMGLMQQTLINLLMTATSDDEPEEIWSLEKYFYAMFLGQWTGGLFLANAAVSAGYNWAVGRRSYNDSGNLMVDEVNLAIRAFNKRGDTFNFDDPDAMIKQWSTISRAAAVTYSAGAAAAAINLLKTGRGVQKNITSED